MRYAVILLTIIVSLTVGGTLLHDYKGNVIFNLPNGKYDMPLWYFVLALVISLIVLIAGVKFIWSIIRLPKTLRRFGKDRKKLKANNLLQKGMLAMGKGHWKQAEKYLIKGAKVSAAASQDPPLFLSTAAEAAQNLGAEARRDQYLLDARQLAAEGIDTFTAALTEAQLHLTNKAPDKAISVLKPHHGSHFLNPQLISTEIKAYTQLEDYESAWGLLANLKKHLPNKDAYFAKQAEIATALFQSHKSRLDTVEKAWSELPKATKKHDDVLLNYVSALIYLDQAEKAEKILVSAIKSDFSDPLIHAYAQIESGSSTQKLSRIKGWLKYHPNNAYLNYGAAKFAHQTEDFATAKEYAERSLKELALPETLALLGNICESLGEKGNALEAYKGSVKLTYASDRHTPVSGELLKNQPTIALPKADEDIENLA